MSLAGCLTPATLTLQPFDCLMGVKSESKPSRRAYYQQMLWCSASVMQASAVKPLLQCKGDVKTENGSSNQQRWMQVNNNLLTGCLPSSWTTGLSNITQIDVSYNQLAGPIPTSWQASGAFPTLQTM